MSPKPETPLWQLTVGEFRQLQEELTATARYVYGVDGLAKLFGCSLTTAKEWLADGRIAKAVRRADRKIIIHAQLALDLADKATRGK